MADLRILVGVPAALLAVSVGYIVINPSGGTVNPIPTATLTRAPLQTYTPTATPTPVPAPLELEGTLVWKPADEGLRAVEFPSGEAVKPPPLEYERASMSFDREWRSVINPVPGTGDWEISFYAHGGRSERIEGIGPVDGLGAGWSPVSNAFAFGVAEGGRDARAIAVVEDPSAPAPFVVYRPPVDSVHTAYSWYANELIVAVDDGTATNILFVGLDGTQRPFGDVGLGPGAVSYLDASPDGHTYAFESAGPDGQRLMTIDARARTVTDHGLRRTDVSYALPAVDLPCSPNPGGFFWSPDGSRLAVGGGFAPQIPSLKIVDVVSARAVETEFASGLPTDFAWSPDGASLGVVTYDPTGGRYEVWVIDPLTGSGRFLVAGCDIIWSPDSRYLAIHGLSPPGVAVIEMATGARVQVTTERPDVPVSWTE